MAEVDFDAVTKRFGETTAVDELTLRVPDGELLVLLGSSGCGKTTALRLVAGLEEVSAGAVSIGIAIFLILELSHPYTGLIRLSPDGIDRVLEILSQTEKKPAG